MGLRKKLKKAIKKVGKTVAKVAGGSLGGGLIGGPLGGLIGGTLGAARGGPATLRNIGQSALGGGIAGGALSGLGALGIAGGGGILGGLVKSIPGLQGLGGMFGGGGIPGEGLESGGDQGQLANLLSLQNLIGGGLIGAGLAQDIDIPQINLPSAEETNRMIQDLETRQADIDRRFLEGEATQQDVLERQTLERLSPLLQQEQARQAQFQTETGERLGALLPQEEAALRGLEQETESRFAGGREALEQQLGREREQRIQELATGPEGVRLRAELSRLGLGDSGLLTQELGRRFTDLAREQQGELARQRIEDLERGQRLAEARTGRLSQLRELVPTTQQAFAEREFGELQRLGQLPALEQQRLAELGAQRLGDIRGNQFEFGRGLRTSGLERQFGLQDIRAESDLQRALELARQRGERQRALIGAGAQVIGGGFGGRVPQFGGGEPGAGGGGGLGSIGGLIGGALGGISDVFGRIFRRRQTGPRLASPRLNLPGLPQFGGLPGIYS